MRTRVLALAVLALAGCGDDKPAQDPFEAVDPTAVLSEDDLAKAAPRWERVTEIRGRGAAAETLEIPGETIQWRVRWRCTDPGPLTMTLATERLVDARCPGRGTAGAIRGGRLRLDVEARGGWSAVVEQQVDAPLDEPPPPGLGPPLARGSFAPVEKRGSGQATLHRLPGGRLALRFADFHTSASSDLELWVGRGPRPQTSEAAVRSRHRVVARLKATAGAQNYRLPRAMRRADVQWVVLWCEPLSMAYASAALRSR